MAHVDALTELPLRPEFHSDLELRVLAGKPFHVLLLSIDRFKLVNGNKSSERGDWLLRRVGQAVVDKSPHGARAFRVGGDEFAVLLPSGLTANPVGVGERICTAVAAITIPGADGPDPCPPHASCTVGVASYPDDATTARALIEAADVGVFIGKRAGPGRVYEAAAFGFRPVAHDVRRPDAE